MMTDQSTSNWMAVINDNFHPLEKTPPKPTFTDLCFWIARQIQRETLIDFMTNRAVRDACVTKDDKNIGLISTASAYSRARLIFVLSRWLTADMLASRPRHLDGAAMFDFASAIIETINLAIDRALLPAFQHGMIGLIEQQIIDGNQLKTPAFEPVVGLFVEYSNAEITSYLDHLVGLLRGCNSPTELEFVVRLATTTHETLCTVHWEETSDGSPARLCLPEHKMVAVFPPYIAEEQLLDMSVANEQIAGWDVFRVYRDSPVQHYLTRIERAVGEG